MLRMLLSGMFVLALAPAGAAASDAPGASAAETTGTPGVTPAPAESSGAPSGASAAPESAAAATPSAPEAKAAAKKTGRKTESGLVVLETVLGKITIRLHDKDAPKTSANFRKLVAEKFYDGTCFHRVIPGFMIQGGDPNSKNDDPSDDGRGSPGYTVPAEIKLAHLRGSVATARQGDQINPKRESSGSQFFIDVAPQSSLDQGGYTVFGEVVSGMDVVDKIVALGNDPSLPAAGGGGRNPGKKAQITRAYVEGARAAKPATAAGKKK